MRHRLSHHNQAPSEIFINFQSHNHDLDNLVLHYRNAIDSASFLSILHSTLAEVARRMEEILRLKTLLMRCHFDGRLRLRGWVEISWCLGMGFWDTMGWDGINTDMLVIIASTKDWLTRWEVSRRICWGVCTVMMGIEVEHCKGEIGHGRFISWGSGILGNELLNTECGWMDAMLWKIDLESFC